eukprot:s4163_g2.t1
MWPLVEPPAGTEEVFLWIQTSSSLFGKCKVNVATVNEELVPAGDEEVLMKILTWDSDKVQRCSLRCRPPRRE